MKRICLFALALATGVAVNAQDAPKLRTEMAMKPYFGIKAGVNSARLEIDDDGTNAAGYNTNNKTSLHAGVFYQIPISSSFRIQPELIYNIQGTKVNAISSTDPNLSGLNEVDLHYISVPLMFQFVSPGGFHVEAGPQFSFLSSANGDRANNGGEVNLKDGDYVKKVDFSLGGGVGYTTRVGLGVHAKYVHGFTNVWANENSPNAGSGMQWRNRNLQFGLHYMFGAAK